MVSWYARIAVAWRSVHFIRLSDSFRGAARIVASAFYYGIAECDLRLRKSKNGSGLVVVMTMSVMMVMMGVFERSIFHHHSAAAVLCGASLPFKLDCGVGNTKART